MATRKSVPVSPARSLRGRDSGVKDRDQKDNNEDEQTFRRSGRSRNNKSALELLGKSPARKRAEKETPTPKKGPAREKTQVKQEVPDPPIRSPRGRPSLRRNSEIVSTPANNKVVVEKLDEVSTPPVVKRGRGRPPKNKPPPQIELDAEPEQTETPDPLVIEPEKIQEDGESTDLVESAEPELVQVIEIKPTDEPTNFIEEAIIEEGAQVITLESPKPSIKKRLSIRKPHEEGERIVVQETGDLSTRQSQAQKRRDSAFEEIKIAEVEIENEPGEIDYQLETGEIEYEKETLEEEVIVAEKELEEGEIDLTGSQELQPLPDTTPETSTQQQEEEAHSEQIVFMRSNDGRMVEFHGNNDMTFEAMEELANKAIFDQEGVHGPETRKWNMSSAIKKGTKEKRKPVIEEQTVRKPVAEDDEETEDEDEVGFRRRGLEEGEIQTDGELEQGEVRFNEGSDEDDELDADALSLRRVAMKMINANSHASASELAKQIDDMEEVEPVTDQHITSQKRSSKTGRCRPVKQIIMKKELQEMVDRMEANDHFEEHVTIDWDAASGRRKTMHCKYCDELLLHKHDFRKHIKKHPEVDYKPFTCPKCGYKAQIKAQIVRHINIHSEVKPYMCTECGKCFNFKQKLQLHMKYHQDIRDQLCPYCPLGFHEQKTLKNHLMKIHNVSDIKGFMKEWSYRKTLQKTKRVDMSDFISSRMDSVGIVHVVHANDKEREQPTDGHVVTVDTNPESGSVVVQSITPKTEPEEGGTNVILVQGDGEIGEMDMNTLQQAVQEALGPNETIAQVHVVGSMDSSEAQAAVQNLTKPEAKPQSKLKQQLVVAEDGVVSISIPERPYISQIPTSNLAEDEFVDGAIEDPITKKKSMVYGCRKTKLHTHRYKMGMVAMDPINIPKKDMLEADREAEKTAPSAEALASLSKSIKRKAGIDPLTGKKKRFVNNQRIVRADQVEKNLLEYCTIKNPDTSGGELPKIQFYCKLCEEYNTSFPSKSQFVEHLEETHREVKAWKCHLCNYSCRLRTTLAVHLKVHSGIKEHKCHICGREFYFKQKLNAHLRHHANIRPHKCPDCGKAFSEKNDLTKHTRRVHQNINPTPCDICGKEFSDRTQLKRHVQSHVGEKTFLCTYCNKYYRSKMSLNQHMKSHTCMFHCEICDRNFGSYSGFMAHKVMHDESYEGYVCELCNAVLHTKGSLNRHKKIAHSDERPFQCEICKKAFKAKKDLKNHEIVHKTEKQYVCSVCSFSCKRLESLRVHMRRHAEVKPYQCGICGKEYTQKFSLETHIKRHTGHVEGTCSICKKSFITKYQLEQHMKKKHGQAEDGDGAMTVFMCEECNAVFLSQDQLAVHILAEHMKQGFVGGPPLGGLGSELKKEDAAPEAENVVEVMAENADQPDDAYPLQTVEHIVSISDPNVTDGKKFITLVEPVPQSEQQELHTEMEELTEESLSTVPVTTDALNTSVSHIVSDANVVMEMDAETVMEVDSGLNDHTQLVDMDGGNPGNTFVTITDPNTNQEYTVAVPTNTIEYLRSVEAEHELIGEEVETQQFVDVAETVEIPVESQQAEDSQ